jgi:hypothetical protein
MTNEELQSQIDELRGIVDDLEAKVSDLWARPKMPYSQNAFSGDLLALDPNLRPEWITP